MVTLHCPDWHHICSFVGPCGIEKHDFLRQLRQYIPAHDYVMVGNILGISGASDDHVLRTAQAGASSKKVSSLKGCAE